MVNLPTEWNKIERSVTFSGHSKIFNHCHSMFKSISTRSSSTRINNELNASTDESAASTQRRKSIHIFGNHCPIKKAFSLILNKVDLAICTPPDDTEMHEFIRHTTSEENLNTITRSPSNTIIDQRSLFSHHTCSTTVHRTFSHLKNKFRCRYEHRENDYEKNNGYLVVVTPDSEPILVQNDSIDHQQTQHAQPCVQINEATFDLNQIQYTSSTPITPNLLPSQLLPYIPNDDIRPNHELDLQSTRSSIECGIPQADGIEISYMVSPSSTNSSSHEYTGIDRSMLDDIEYVRAQELDLDRIIDFEVSLSNERHGLQLDLEEEQDFNNLYDETLQENVKLKEELQILQEEYDQKYSTWSCTLCTYLNQPYSDTNCDRYQIRDRCEMCDTPSPLTQTMFTK